MASNDRTCHILRVATYMRSLHASINSPCASTQCRHHTPTAPSKACHTHMMRHTRARPTLPTSDDVPGRKTRPVGCRCCVRAIYPIPRQSSNVVRCSGRPCMPAANRNAAPAAQCLCVQAPDATVDALVPFTLVQTSGEHATRPCTTLRSSKHGEVAD